MLVKGDDKQTPSGEATVEPTLKTEGSRTDSETVAREAEAIQIDGLNAAQVNELRDKVSLKLFPRKL